MHRTIVAILAISSALLPSAAAGGEDHAPVCEGTPHTFRETFDDTTHRDAASSVDKWGTGSITCRSKGTGFQADPTAIGVQVYLVAKGNWDGDAKTDMVGLLISPDCHLHYMKNLGTDAGGNHLGFDLGGAVGSAGFNNWKLGSPAGCNIDSPVLLSGDFDGDGDTDLVFLKVTNESGAGQLSAAALYQYTGWDAVKRAPKFIIEDVFSDFSQVAAGHTLAWHWTATVAQTVDWDKDGADDVVVASSHAGINELLLFRGKKSGASGYPGFYPAQTLIPNLGFYTPIASSSSIASGGSSCPPAVSRGPSAVIVADFDRDGDFDAILGSASEKNLKYWKNDGTGLFSRQTDIPFAAGASDVGLTGDFDGDGDTDFMLGRDGWNCGGTGGTVWLFINDGKGSFKMRTTPVANLGSDLDFGIAFDIDNDADHTTDAVFADGNNSGNYFKIIAKKLSIFNLEGTAYSTVIDSLDPDTHAITGVQITNLSAELPAGSSIDGYLSNDNGRHWERVLDRELPPPYGSGEIHYFTQYGSELRWKAVLNAPEATLTGDEALYAPAAKLSPALNELELTYYSVDRRRYSRSGLAYGKVGGREMMFSANYHFPGWDASLLAYDITDLPIMTATGVDRVDMGHAEVVLKWDAGALLTSRPSTNRKIYGAFSRAADGDGVMNDLVSISLNELTTPTTSPTLQSLLVADEATKAAVVRYIRGRLGNNTDDRPHKLFDTGHSTPVFVGAPAGDADYFGGDYSAFKTAKAERDPMVYLGTNDGMLHAFTASSGEEAWALAPNNLMAKLKLQRGINAAGTEYYEHDLYVDGPLAIQDIHDGSSWKTVAFVAQARGKGAYDRNYYSAVDVTDPSQPPKPLWEFSAPSNYEACSGEPCTNVCTDTCSAPACSSSCTATPHTFAESGGLVVMEADHANSNASTDGLHNWVLGSASGVTYMLATPSDGTDCGEDGDNCGAGMTFSAVINTPGDYRPYFRVKVPSSASDALIWGMNGVPLERVSLGSTYNAWIWVAGTPVSLAASDTVLSLWMAKPGLQVDRIVLTTGAAPSGTGPAEVCENLCEPPSCTTSCTVSCVAPGDAWPECGADRECCGTPGMAYCAPMGKCSEVQPSPQLGETWSAPVAARVMIGGATRWVVFFGSGYNNLGAPNVGRSLWALDAANGTLLGRWDVDDLEASASNPPTILNTLPASPSAVDVNGDRYVDRIYFADLEGRLWRLDVSADAVLSGTPSLISNWAAVKVFDAGQESASSAVRQWAPIITKPATSVVDSASGKVNVYFGTGGDDLAPPDGRYFFYSVRDDGSATTRYPSQLDASRKEWRITAASSHKYWADPMIADGAVVYFASLPGNIESVNPCLSLEGTSKLYGIAVRDFTDKAGVAHAAGESIFAGKDYLDTFAKVRQMMVQRGAQPEPWARPATLVTVAATDVLFQEFTGEDAADRPAVRRIPFSGVNATRRLRVTHWREVPREKW